MHLLDPTRDRALMNKSCDVLIPECGIPACWYSAVKDEGLTRRSDNGRLTSENVILKQCRCTNNCPHPSNLGAEAQCGICVAELDAISSSGSDKGDKKVCPTSELYLITVLVTTSMPRAGSCTYKLCRSLGGVSDVPV